VVACSGRDVCYYWLWEACRPRVGVLHLILSGLFDELPELQIIVGHWGELVPFYLNRLGDQQSKTLQLRYKISDYFKRNICLISSVFFSNEQLGYIVKTLGADRIIYSADYPFLLDRDTRKFLERAPLSEEEKAKIGYLNAERLLRLSN